MTMVVQQMDVLEARRLTEEVKVDAQEIWSKLLAIYEGGGHLALGYASWAAYCEGELDMGKSHGYRLLDAARVARLVTDHSPAGERVETPVPIGDPETENGNREPAPESLRPPSNEHVARKLAATARTDPRRAESIWRQTVAQYGEDATADQVAAIAGGNGAPSPPPEDDLEWRAEMKTLASDLRRVAKNADPKDARRALVRWRAMYTRLDSIAKGS